MKLYGIFGAGGFGREVMPVARDMLQRQHPDEDYRLVFIDDAVSPQGIATSCEVLDLEAFFSTPAKERFFNIAIAGFAARKRIAELMLEKNARPFSIQAANSIILDNNQIGEGAIFCPFTTVTSDAKIGRFFHANLYSYVAHDCKIGDYVTFAPNVHCNGNVEIEDFVYVGTGVIIREGRPDRPIIIGKGAILGMGAVVTKSVAPYETVIGNPARSLAVKAL